MGRRRAIAAMAPLALLLVAGCGGTNANTANIEQQLEKQVAKQAGVQADQVVADCPQNEKLEVGRTFECTLRYSGARRTVVIRLESDDTFSAKILTKTAPKTETQ